MTSTIGGVTKPTNTKAQGSAVPWLDPNYGYTVKKTAAGKTTLVYKNPSGLGEQLGKTVIQGVWDLLGDAGAAGLNSGWNAMGGRNPLATGALVGKNLTADQAMYLFEHTTPQQLAYVQQKLYSAGLYGKKLPNLGVFTKADKDAFRSALVGLASSPGQGPLGGYLDAASQQTQAVKVRAPLVIKHVDDNVLSATFQQAATQLLGEFLPPSQLSGMISAYHQLETTNAQTAYNAGDPNATGVLDAGPGGDANVTPTPTEYAGANLQSVNPTQYKANSFGSKVMSALDSLRTTGYLPSGG